MKKIRINKIEDYIEQEVKINGWVYMALPLEILLSMNYVRVVFGLVVAQLPNNWQEYDLQPF